jgi:hypothetical protein
LSINDDVSSSGVDASERDAPRGGVTIEGDVSGQVASGDTVIQVQGGPATEPTRAPVTILFWAANPAGTPPLRLDEEIRTIDERLRATEQRDRFVLQQQWALRVGDLSEGLFRYRPGIVHFSGHGSPEGQLMLETPSGTSAAVPSAALAGLFEAVMSSPSGPSPICVVFNACYSAAQAAAVAHHVPCVVGTTKAIGDDAAIHFAAGFYRALGYGATVQSAFDVGCNEIALYDLGEELTPRLHVRPGIDPRTLTIV